MGNVPLLCLIARGHSVTQITRTLHTKSPLTCTFRNTNRSSTIWLCYRCIPVIMFVLSNMASLFSWAFKETTAAIQVLKQWNTCDIFDRTFFLAGFGNLAPSFQRFIRGWSSCNSPLKHGTSKAELGHDIKAATVCGQWPKKETMWGIQLQEQGFNLVDNNYINTIKGYMEWGYKQPSGKLYKSSTIGASLLYYGFPSKMPNVWVATNFQTHPKIRLLVSYVPLYSLQILLVSPLSDYKPMICASYPILEHTQRPYR